MSCLFGCFRADEQVVAHKKDAPSTTTSSEMIAHAEKLTSSVYGPDHAPADWQDGVFLVPHEMVRRETNAFVRSVEALQDSSEPWKLTLMSRWYIEYYHECIMEHHDNEEEIYFPFLEANGAKFPEAKGMVMSHKELVEALQQMKMIFETILDKEGQECLGEIAILKKKVPSFAKDMFEHLAEEERDIPPVIRSIGISEAENDAVVEQLIAHSGLVGLKYLIPGVLVAAEEWMSEDFYANFQNSIPPPIMELLKSTLLPNYHSVICPMRDAATLASEPDLTKEIPLDMSKLPPPPGAGDEKKE